MTTKFRSKMFTDYFRVHFTNNLIFSKIALMHPFPVDCHKYYIIKLLCDVVS